MLTIYLSLVKYEYFTLLYLFVSGMICHSFYLLVLIIMGRLSYLVAHCLEGKANKITSGA